MDDATKRAANWEAKYNTERVKATLDDLHAKMAERYRAAVAPLVAMENSKPFSRLIFTPSNSGGVMRY